MLNRLVGWLYTVLKILTAVIICLMSLGKSVLPPADQIEKIRAYTRDIEFDYINWSLDALAGKYADFTVSAPRYLSLDEQRSVVEDYLRLVREMNQISGAIEEIYADPAVADPAAAAAQLSAALEKRRAEKDRIQPIAESVLQYQVGVIAAEQDLALGGQPVPPVLYHVTDLPYALIISPRNVIRQDANISLVAGLTLEQITRLEKSIEADQNVSALVVPVGGVGIYPTMVMSTTSLPWLLEVVSHEWIHNYLTLRPLGVNYDTTPQLRTMNETTAALAGKEMGYLALERFYQDIAAKVEPPPSLLPEPEEQPAAPPGPRPTPKPTDPNAFSFNREMRQTRVTVDEMLAAGKIAEAEAYMEERRQFFWDNGYQIRRLNQAYFAFNGAYDETPGGGAAGQDPVGPAVRKLRRDSASLAEFINRIAMLTSFDELQKLTR